MTKHIPVEGDLSNPEHFAHWHKSWMSDRAARLTDIQQNAAIALSNVIKKMLGHPFEHPLTIMTAASKLQPESAATVAGSTSSSEIAAVLMKDNPSQDPN